MIGADRVCATIRNNNFSDLTKTRVKRIVQAIYNSLNLDPAIFDYSKALWKHWVSFYFKMFLNY